MNSRRAPTKTMLQTLDAIVAFKAAHDGVAPTVRELAAAIGIYSKFATTVRIENLEDAGLITRIERQARTIQVVGGQWIPPPAQ